MWWAGGVPHRPVVRAAAALSRRSQPRLVRSSLERVLLCMACQALRSPCQDLLADAVDPWHLLGAGLSSRQHAFVFLSRELRIQVTSLNVRVRSRNTPFLSGEPGMQTGPRVLGGEPWPQASWVLTCCAHRLGNS